MAASERRSERETPSGKDGVLLYGATGYTGKLIAETAKKRGLKATLAGRNEKKLRELSDKIGLPFVAFDLHERQKLDAAVAEHAAVLHIAGPFTVTSPPMVDACLRNGAHYLDITGEGKVIERIANRGPEAAEKGVMLMPAVGYDAVPGDCLAAHLKRRLPTATHLDVGVFMSRGMPKGQFSHGTALSAALHILPFGGMARKDGKLVPETIFARKHEFDLGDGKPPLAGWSFPAAEVLVTGHTTGIPNTSAYVPAHFPQFPLKALSWLGPGVVNWWPIKRTIELGISLVPSGPQTEEQIQGSALMTLAEARDEKNVKRVKGLVKVGPAYPFTASASCEIVRRVLNGDFKPGFQTPASVYGPDLLLEIPDEKVERKDID